jgi:hypothetical protein
MLALEQFLVLVLVLVVSVVVMYAPAKVLQRIMPNPKGVAGRLMLVTGIVGIAISMTLFN